MSSVLLPEVRSTGFAFGRAVECIAKAIGAGLVGALAVRFGLTQALLWVGVGIAVLGALMNTAYYFTAINDQAGIQNVLRQRAERELSAAGRES